MIIDMVRQTNEVYITKASAAINTMSMDECKGCNVHFASTAMVSKTYKHPFNGNICKGYFCSKCESDPKVKELFR